MREHTLKNKKKTFWKVKLEKSENVWVLKGVENKKKLIMLNYLNETRVLKNFIFFISLFDLKTCLFIPDSVKIINECQRASFSPLTSFILTSNTELRKFLWESSLLRAISYWESMERWWMTTKQLDIKRSDGANWLLGAGSGQILESEWGWRVYIEPVVHLMTNVLHFLPRQTLGFVILSMWVNPLTTCLFRKEITPGLMVGIW